MRFIVTLEQSNNNPIRDHRLTNTKWQEWASSLGAVGQLGPTVSQTLQNIISAVGWPSELTIRPYY